MVLKLTHQPQALGREGVCLFGQLSSLFFAPAPFGSRNFTEEKETIRGRISKRVSPFLGRREGHFFF